MNPKPQPKKQPTLSEIVQDGGLLRHVITAQMTALGNQRKNTDWLVWTATAAWQALSGNAEPQDLIRYELAWRTLYKRGMHKAGLANLARADFAEKPTVKEVMRLLTTTETLNFASAFMCWRELTDDNAAFYAFPPTGATWGLTIEAEDAITAALTEMDHEVHWRPRDQCGWAAVICEGDKTRTPVMRRQRQDIDIRDWEHSILRGEAEGFIIVAAEDHEDVLQGSCRNHMTPGILIGGGNEQVFQRMPNGSLVNVTKHPGKLRKDLPGYRGR